MPPGSGESNSFSIEKSQWTFVTNPLDCAHFMKCGTTNTVLTLVLAVLLLADVVFALRTIILTREFRTMQSQVVSRQASMNRLNLLLQEAVQYGKTHPDINPVIQPFEGKPAVH
jgi:hypothetical protein